MVEWKYLKMSYLNLNLQYIFDFCCDWVSIDWMPNGIVLLEIEAFERRFPDDDNCHENRHFLWLFLAWFSSVQSKEDNRGACCKTTLNDDEHVSHQH